MHTVVMRNQVPIELDVESVTDDPTVKFDPMAMLRAYAIDPMMQPGTTLEVDGQPMDADELLDVVAATLTTTVDVDAEDVANDVLSRGLMHYDPTWRLPTRRLPVREAACRMSMPRPDPRTAIYLAATDVIPAARAWLQAPSKDSRDVLAASIGLTYDPQALGVVVRDEAELADLESAVAAYAATLQGLPQDTVTLLGQFASLKFGGDLLVPLRLRCGSADGNDELSFPRVLLEGIRAWSRNAGGRMLAFDMGELVCPTALVLVSADAHAHADSHQVNQAWQDVVDGLAHAPTVLSQAQLSRVDANARQMRQAQAKVDASIVGDPKSKTSHRAFATSCPTALDLSRFVCAISERMGDVMRSQNAYKARHRTFARQSRRNPDDIDRPGVSISTRYHPDIHLYVDTSGSISERNYEDEVKAIIRLARKLDVNVWFTSFSDYMTKPALLHLKGRSVRQAYAEVERLDKADGGTNFYQIWQYVNASPKRQRELSLVITDFGYMAPNLPVTHPKNLFYAPCSVDGVAWDWICESAEQFIDSMRYIDPNVRARMLM